MSSIAKIRRLRTLLKGVEVDEDRGTLTAYGIRFMLIPAKLLHSIEDRLSELLGPMTATSFVYEIGKEGGSVYVHLLDKAGYKLTDFGAVQKAADQYGSMAGWGKLVLVDTYPRKRMKVRWTNGVSVRNKKGKNPVCHFVRGVMTGAAEEAWGMKCESLELYCEGKGDNYCEVVIGTPEQVSLLAEASRK